MEVEEVEGNAKEYLKAVKLLNNSEVDAESQLKISIFLRNIFQIILNTENGSKAISYSIPVIVEYFKPNRRCFQPYTMENETCKNLLYLLLDTPTNILELHLQNENELFLKFLVQLLFLCNEELALIAYQILNKMWDSLSIPYSKNVGHLLKGIDNAYTHVKMRNVFIAQELKDLVMKAKDTPIRILIEPKKKIIEEENDLVIKTKNISIGIHREEPEEKTIEEEKDLDMETRNIPIRNRREEPKEVILLPVGMASVKLWCEASKFILTIFQKDYEDGDVNALWITLLDFILSTPQDLRNNPRFSILSSLILKTKIRILEVFGQLCHAKEVNTDELWKYPELQSPVKRINYFQSAFKAYVEVWKDCGFRAVYLLHPLISVIRLFSITWRNFSGFKEDEKIFTKDFFAYEDSSFPKSLRADAIEEFLNLSGKYSFFCFEWENRNPQEVLNILDFLLHAVYDPCLPLKIQAQLCLKILPVFKILVLHTDETKRRKFPEEEQNSSKRERFKLSDQEGNRPKLPPEWVLEDDDDNLPVPPQEEIDPKKGNDPVSSEEEDKKESSDEEIIAVPPEQPMEHLEQEIIAVPPEQPMEHLEQEIEIHVPPQQVESSNQERNIQALPKEEIQSSGQKRDIDTCHEEDIQSIQQEREIHAHLLSASIEEEIKSSENENKVNKEPPKKKLKSEFENKVNEERPKKKVKSKFGSPKPPDGGFIKYEVEKTIFYKIFQTLVLKLKSLSKLWRPIDKCKYNRGRPSVNSGSVLRGEKSFDFIKFLQKTDFQMCDVPYHYMECSLKECKDTLVSIVEVIYMIHGEPLFKFDPEEDGPLLPFYFGFLKYTLRVIKVINDESLSEDKKGFEEEIKKTLEKISHILFLLPKDAFRELLVVCKHDLVKSMSISNTVEVFFQNILFHCNVNGCIAATFLFELLLDRVEKLDGDPAEFISILPVYDLLFKAIFTRNCKLEDVVKLYLPEIIRKICKVSVHTREAFGFMKLLLIIFSHCKKADDQDKGVIPELLAAILPAPKFDDYVKRPLVKEILPDLIRLHTISCDQKLKECVINICLFIPFGFKTMDTQAFIEDLLPIIIESLAFESLPITFKALQTLEHILESTLFHENINQHRELILERLYSVLRLGSCTYVEVACRVIGKLGAGNWFVKKISSDPVDSPVISLRHVHKEKGDPREHEVSFPIEKIIQTALNAATKYSESFKWKDCFTIVKHCFHALVSSSSPILNFPPEDEQVQQSHTHKLVLVAMLACCFHEENSETEAYLESCVSYYMQEGISEKENPMKKRLNPFDFIDAFFEFLISELNPSVISFGLKIVRGLLLDCARYGIPVEMVWECKYIQYIVEGIYSFFGSKAWHVRLFACKATELIVALAPRTWFYYNSSRFCESLLFVAENLDVVNVPEKVINDVLEKVMESALTYSRDNDTPLRLLDFRDCFLLLNSNKRIVRNWVWYCLILLKVPLEMHSDFLSDMLSKCFGTSVVKSQLNQMGVIELYLKSNTNFSWNASVERKIDGFLRKCLGICSKYSRLEKERRTKELAHPDVVPSRTFGNYREKELYKACLENLKLLLTHLISDHQQLSDSKSAVLLEGSLALLSEEPEISFTAFKCLKNLGYDLQDKVTFITRYVNENILDAEVSKIRDLAHMCYYLDIFLPYIENDLRKEVISKLESSISIILSRDYGVLSKVINSEFQFHWVLYAPLEVFKALFDVYPKICFDHDSKFSYVFEKYFSTLLTESLDYFFNLLFDDPSWMSLERYREYFTSFIRKKCGEPLRRTIMENHFLYGNFQGLCYQKLQLREPVDFDFISLEYSTIEIIYSFSKLDQEFLKDSHELADKLWSIWKSEDFQMIIYELDAKEYQSFRVYKWLSKSLLMYYKLNRHKVQLLFSLLIPLSTSFSQNFRFLSNFLDEVTKSYDDEWKNIAFKCFIELFHDDSLSLDVKSKVLELVIIPSLTVSFSLLKDPHLIHMFIEETMRFCKHFHDSDDLKVRLLQIYCLILKYGSSCIVGGCCSERNFYEEIVYFSRFCTWDGKRSQNMMLKSHGNLLMMHIVKYACRDCNTTILSLILSNLCEVCPPDVQNLDLYIVQSLLKYDVAKRRLKFKEWAEELFANNRKEHAYVHLHNMISHCFEVFDFQRRNVVGDLIQIANLLDFNDRAFKENKELIFQVVLKFFDKIKVMNEEEEANAVYRDSESVEEIIPEKEMALFLCRVNPSQCSDSILDKPESKKLRVTNLIGDLLVKSSDEESKMDVVETTDAATKSSLDILSKNSVQFDKETLKVSTWKWKLNMILSLFNYLLDFGSQESLSKSDETIDKCWSFLKSELTSHPFSTAYNHLNWWFKENISRAAKSDVLEACLLLHIFLSKLNLEASCTAKLVAFFEGVCLIFRECAGKTLLERLREMEQEGNAPNSDIFQRFVLETVYQLYHPINEPFVVPLARVIEMIEALDFSMISIKGHSFIASELCRSLEGKRINLKELETIPIEKIEEIFRKLLKLPAFDDFTLEILYKAYSMSSKTKETALSINLDYIVNEAVRTRLYNRFLIIANKRKGRGEELTPIILPKMHHHLHSENYCVFMKAFEKLNMEKKSFKHRMKYLISKKLISPSLSLSFCVAFFIHCLEIVPHESIFLPTANLSTPSLLDAMISLCLQSESFTEFLWSCMVPKVWDLSESQRLYFILDENKKANDIESMLDTHFKYYEYKEKSLPQSLLVFAENLLSHSPGSFSLDLHRDFGRRYSMWHKTSVLFNLEDHTYPQRKDVFVAELSEAYAVMNEQDMVYGLIKLYAGAWHTVAGVVLEQQGLFKDAMREYLNCLDRDKSNWEWRNRLIRYRQELGRWEWSLDLSGWTLNPPTKGVCFCNNLVNTLRKVIKRATGLKFRETFLMVHELDSCSSQLMQIYNKVTEFISNEYKMLPLTISESHVSMVEAMRIVEECKDIISFTESLRKKEEPLKKVEKMYFKWAFLKTSLHEKLSFWHDIFSLRLKVCGQLESSDIIKELDMSEMEKILVSHGTGAKIACIKKLASVEIMHASDVHTVKSLFQGVSDIWDLESLELVIQAFFAQADRSISNEQKKEVMNSALAYFKHQSRRLGALPRKQQPSQAKINLVQSKIEKEIKDLVDGSAAFDTISWFKIKTILTERVRLSARAYSDKVKFMKKVMESLLRESEDQSLKDSCHSFSQVLFFLSIHGVLENTLEMNLLDTVPLYYWLPWISELLTIYMENKSPPVLRIIEAIGKSYPQSLEVWIREVKSSDFGQNAEHPLDKLVNHNPSLKITLNRIYDELCEFKKRRTEPILVSLNKVLDELYGVSYVCMGSQQNFNDVSNFWRNLRFRLEEFKDKDWFPRMMQEVNERSDREEGLCSLLEFLSRWIDYHTKAISPTFRLDSQYLLKFYQTDHKIDLLTLGVEQPREFVVKEVKIHRFLPKVDFIKKFNEATYRFYIEGDDGKIYPYTFVSPPFIQTIRKGNNLNRFLSCLNITMSEHRESVKNGLSLKIPDIITLSADVHIIRDDASSVLFSDICMQTFPTNFDPIRKFYEEAVKLYVDQDSPLNDSQIEGIYMNLLQPENCFKKWFHRRFTHTADYLKFRKQFAKSLALFGFVKRAFRLSSQYPANMLVHKDDGQITNIGYTFNFTDKGEEADHDEVPFRFTPAIASFLTQPGVTGMFCPVMNTAATCFRTHQKYIQKLIELFLLHDVLYLHDVPEEAPVLTKPQKISIIDEVVKAAERITNDISSYIELYDEALHNYQSDFNIPFLAGLACNAACLCEMDPVWLPWC